MTMFATEVLPAHIQICLFWFGAFLVLFSVLSALCHLFLNKQRPPDTEIGEEWSLKQVIDHIAFTRSVSPNEAAQDLKDKLAGGNLRSRGLWLGRENRDQTRRFIEPAEWVNLWFPVDTTVERGTNFVQRMSGELGQYREIGFESAAVKRIWK